jgi:hypothetical protein
MTAATVGKASLLCFKDGLDARSPGYRVELPHRCWQRKREEGRNEGSLAESGKLSKRQNRNIVTIPITLFPPRKPPL